MRESTAKIVHQAWVPALIVLLVALDQWTKWLAVRDLANHHVFTIIPGFFDFSLVRNTGAAFGMGTKMTPLLRKVIFTGVSSVAAVVMIYLLVKMRREGWFPRLGITLILAGAVGNLIDRVRFGYVVDFIHVFYKTYHWPNFNVADSSICVGITLFAIFLLWVDHKKANP